MHPSWLGGDSGLSAEEKERSKPQVTQGLAR